MGQAFHIVPSRKRGDKRRGGNQRIGLARDVLFSDYEHCGQRCDFPIRSPQGVTQHVACNVNILPSLV